MPRLVCLLIKDNDLAESFVETLQHPEKGVQFPPMGTVPLAMFAVPTLECECPKEDKMRIALGQTYGWWVHRDCGRVLPNSWQSPRNLLASDVRDQRVHVNWSFQAPIVGLQPANMNGSRLS